MRLRPLPSSPALRAGVLALLGAVACLALAGCGLSGGGGGAGGSSRGHVTLALSVPTPGSTVGVPQIEVIGQVTPDDATVRINDGPATVAGGAFRGSVRLSPGTDTIPVTAAAPGYAATTIRVTVTYSAQLAASLAAARQTLSAATAGTASAAGAQMVAATQGTGPAFLPHIDLGSTGSGTLTSAPPRTTTIPPASTAQTVPAPTTASETPTPTPTPPRTSGTGHPVPVSGRPAPSAPPALTAADIKRIYVDSCSHAGGAPARSYCACMGDHLARAGYLSSVRQVRALNNAIRRFIQTGNILVLPGRIRQSQAICVSRLPHPDLRVRQLPALHHPAAPALVR